MEIKHDKQNDLMKRREISFVFESSKIPSFAEASKMISEKVKAPEEHILVERIDGKFGRSNFVVSASIYDTKELKEEAVKRVAKTKKTVAPAA